jgi:hypothetical protein
VRGHLQHFPRVPAQALGIRLRRGKAGELEAQFIDAVRIVPDEVPR